jgi:AcrR family transcriptional regulator
MVAKVCTVTLALVRERGLGNINTNLIAQEAGVDISSLYRFFANKEAILYHIAQGWLADIREVYDRYEQEPALLALDWRDYFDGLLRDWRLPGQYEKYAALAGLWHVYPDLVKLERFQEAYHVAFFMRQFKRLGAIGNQQHWKDLAVYLYHVEDTVHEVASGLPEARAVALRQIYHQSFMNLVGEILG